VRDLNDTLGVKDIGRKVTKRRNSVEVRTELKTEGIHFRSQFFTGLSETFAVLISLIQSI
jgi:hypothetical protein